MTMLEEEIFESTYKDFKSGFWGLAFQFHTTFSLILVSQEFHPNEKWAYFKVQSHIPLGNNEAEHEWVKPLEVTSKSGCPRI